MTDTALGRNQCPLEATWTGRLHVGRAIYVAASCDRHKAGLVDAEPFDGDWDRAMTQAPMSSDSAQDS